ncbi:MAG TPA: MFS transporter, partial [Acidimicrobiales bacterium]|nr:MFS transporter [Acidimicrobiales bacterium]
MSPATGEPTPHEREWATPDDGGIAYGTTSACWILLATVLGSGMAFLDGTVVNVALPAIGKNFSASVAGLQWVLTGYLVTLSALILIGGSLGDIFGRRRVFVAGVVWFSAASLLCAAAPTLGVLIAARTLQGVGGALLVPGSLSIIQSNFRPEDRGRAIGMWSGLGGVAGAIGPLAGGALVTGVSWRLIFVLNLPVAALVLVAARHLPESHDETVSRHVDVRGAALGVLGLSGLAYALIEGPSGNANRSSVVVAGVAAVVGLVGFVVAEHRSPHPMLPLGIFSSRQFTVSNVLTFAVYGALSGVLFLLAVDLQQVLGYSALEAGASMLPITLLMLVFSAKAGALATRIGPRLPMSLGPLIITAGLLLMTRVQVGSHYLTSVLPSVVVFGAGLVLTVAPLTTTVLAAVEATHA